MVLESVERAFQSLFLIPEVHGKDEKCNVPQKTHLRPHRMAIKLHFLNRCSINFVTYIGIIYFAL